MDTIALSDLRADLPSIVKKICKNRKRLIITVHGRPMAVLISVKELERIEKNIGAKSFLPVEFKGYLKIKR